MENIEGEDDGVQRGVGLAGKAAGIVEIAGGAGGGADETGKGELGGQPLFPPTPMIGHLRDEGQPLHPQTLMIGHFTREGPPLYPATSVIGHLTNEEIEALNDVFSRMELFEAEESARIRYTRLHLPPLNDLVGLYTRPVNQIPLSELLVLFGSGTDPISLLISCSCCSCCCFCRDDVLPEANGSVVSRQKTDRDEIWREQKMLKR